MGVEAAYIFIVTAKNVDTRSKGTTEMVQSVIKHDLQPLLSITLFL